MITTRDLKYAPRVGERALLNVLHPSPVHAHRHLVLGLASHRAGVTPNTLAIVDYKSVFHPPKCPPQRQTIILGSGQKVRSEIHSERVLGGAREEGCAIQIGSDEPKREGQIGLGGAPGVPARPALHR